MVNDGQNDSDVDGPTEAIQTGRYKLCLAVMVAMPLPQKF